MMPKKTLTQDTVMRRIGLSRSTIYKKRIEGTFPQAIKLSDGRIGWHEKDIDEWIDSRPLVKTKKESK